MISSTVTIPAGILECSQNRCHRTSRRSPSSSPPRTVKIHTPTTIETSQCENHNGYHKLKLLRNQSKHRRQRSRLPVFRCCTSQRTKINNENSNMNMLDFNNKENGNNHTLNTPTVEGENDDMFSLKRANPVTDSNCSSNYEYSKEFLPHQRQWSIKDKAALSRTVILRWDDHLQRDQQQDNNNNNNGGDDIATHNTNP